MTFYETESWSVTTGASREKFDGTEDGLQRAKSWCYEQYAAGAASVRIWAKRIDKGSFEYRVVWELPRNSRLQPHQIL